MVLNCVLHRLNLSHVDQIIDMALALGADYLELANTQYYGWAFLNRAQLVPGADQLIEAEAAVNRRRAEIGNRCNIIFVVPDYFEKRPKPCMNGWGSVFVVVSPDGAALPCHAARVLPDLRFPNVTKQTLREIWYDSAAFNAYRGDGWMRDPCRTCEEKEKDFGGCRCQAFLLTGSAENADPVCDLSPSHYTIEHVVEWASATRAVSEKTIVFRTNPPLLAR
jgi:pyrroloquinoline quinone biosynthesis protein E